MKYTVGKVSKLFRISSDTLRHYDKLNLLKPNTDPNNGYRYYEMKHLYQLEFILRAKYLEIPLSEVKEVLDSENLNEYKKLLSTQQEIINEKINHLQKMNLILSNSKKELNEVMNFSENYNFDKIKILTKPINFYYLTVTQYLEDNSISTILGDICNENFDSPTEYNMSEMEFNIYNIVNKHEVIKNEGYIYLPETSKNKEDLDKYFIDRYGKIPVITFDGKYVIEKFYGTEEKLKEYLLSLHDHLKGNTSNDILVRFNFCLYKKIKSEYYWEIIYFLQ